MTRRSRPWLATLALASGLALVAPPASAQFGNVRKVEVVEKKEDNGYIWGYIVTAALVGGFVFTICKPGHRELNVPKK